MNPTPADDGFLANEFLSEFLPAANFGESFQFDNFFDFADGAFVTADSEDGVSCSSSVDSSVIVNRLRCRRRRKRRPNRHAYRKQSVFLSPWYVNFLLPGMTHDLTRELSRSDRFGEFQSLFRINLETMEG